MKMLSPWLPYKQFMQYFPVYYALARKPSADKEKKQLVLFCQAVSTAYLANSTDTNIRNLNDTANLLWVAIHAPNNANLPKKCSDVPQQYFDSDHLDSWATMRTLTEQIRCHEKSAPKIPVIKQDTANQYLSVKPKLSKALTSPAPLTMTAKITDPIANLAKWAALRKELEACEHSYEQTHQQILAELKPLPDLTLAEQNNLFNTLDHQLLQHQKFKNETQDAILTKTTINNNDLISLENTRQKLAKQITEEINLLEEILNRRSPDTINELGKQKEIPSVTTLIAHYAEATAQTYRNIGIQEADLLLLDKSLGTLLSLYTTEKFLIELITAVSQNCQNNTTHSRLRVINALLRKNQTTQKMIALFEYIQQITLFPQQTRMLTLLIESKSATAISYVMQLIMGGGKTKVILPLLLYMLADGKHLPIVIVPDMLLNTCFSDLRSTSYSVFQQDVSIFKFDRESASDSATLQHLYETFTTFIAQKQYLVTTASSMQSLELKYLEILYYINNPQEATPDTAHLNSEEKTEKSSALEDENRLFWLNKLLTLIREYGLAAADEAHQLFHIRKELNYSIGQPKPIPFNVIETSIMLFSWMETVKIDNENKALNSFRDILKNPNQFAEIKTMPAIMEFYICALGNSNTSPHWLEGLIVDPLSVNDLQNYLRGNEATEKKINSLLATLPMLKEKWVLLREEFLSLLPVTLCQKLHENYGPPTDQNTGFIAIPYKANNVPTACVFANILETINYTSQMLYADGLPYELLKARLTLWQEEARSEKGTDATTITASEKIFNFIFKAEKLTLLSLDLENINLIEALHKKYKCHPLLIQQILKDCLGELTIEAAILRSNPINLASMFKLTYGFSGTPKNYRTYHRKFQMCTETSFLIESQVKDYLRIKKTAITNNQQTPDQLLASCVNENDNVRALLDCGGCLPGLSNLEVAKKLARLCSHRHRSIRYILFYQGDVLYAWNIQANDNQIPKKLTNTDPKFIRQELNNCLPEERFTYYDQEHTVGADIQQAENATALLTADAKIGLSSFLQAAMRMRGLGLAQKITVSVDPALAKKIRQLDASQPELERLFHVLEESQQSQLEIDHFHSALKNIDDLFRDDLLVRLLQQPNPISRDMLYKQAEKFFVELQSDDVLALYENKPKRMKTATILERYAKQQFTTWQTILGSRLTQDCAEQLSKELTTLCQKPVKICTDEQLHQLNQTGKEVQKQIQKQKEIQKLVELKQPPSRLRTINLDWINRLFPNYKLTFLYYNKAKSLNELTKHYNQSWKFSSNLYASENFLYTFHNQKETDIYNLHTKKCTTVLFTVENQQLSATLLCSEEAEAFQQSLSKNKPQNLHWLTTINGDHLTPVPESKEISTTNVASLLEQAAYFNGRVEPLINRQRFYWLMDEPEQKVKFFRDHIKTPLGISEEKTQQLQDKLFDLEKIVAEWANYPCEAFTIESWTQKVSKGLRPRLKKLLTILSQIRKLLANPSSEPMKSDAIMNALPLNDALIAENYQSILKLLNSIRKKNYITLADVFSKTKHTLSFGFLDYRLPDEPVIITEESNNLLMAEFKDDKDTQIAWIEQLLSTNSPNITLDLERLITQHLNDITDLNKLARLFKKLLLIKIQKNCDATTIFNVINTLEAPMRASLLQDETLAALPFLEKAKIAYIKIIQKCLTDVNFCKIVQLLGKYGLVSDKLLAHLAQEKNETIHQLKNRLDQLLGDIISNSNDLTERENCIKALCFEKYFRAANIIKTVLNKDTSLIISALLNPDFSAVILYLDQNKLTKSKYLSTLSDPIIFATLLALVNANVNKVVIEEAFENPKFLTLIQLFQQQNIPINHIPLLEIITQKIDLTLITERLNYLLKYKLTEEKFIRTLSTQTAWDTIAILTKNQIDDSNLFGIALVNTDFQENLPAILAFLIAHKPADITQILVKHKNDFITLKKLLTYLANHYKSADPIILLLQDKSFSALKILEKNNIKNITLIELALTDPNTQAVLKTRSSGVSFIESLITLKFVDKNNIHVLLENKAWQAAQLFQGIEQDNSVLLNLALSNDDFQSITQLLLKLDHKLSTTAMEFIQVWQNDLTVARALLETLDKSNGVSTEILQTLDKTTISAMSSLKKYNLLDNEFLLNETIKDSSLRSLFTNQENCKMNQHIIDAIPSISQLRTNYSNTKFYQPYMPAINAYTKEVIVGLLNCNAIKNPAERIRRLCTTAANKHFKHRDLRIRILADTLLAISVIGLFILLARKLSGTSFFFSNAKTTRQDNFEKMLPKAISVN